MKKTRIQTRIQIYEKNTHTNVWQKHAHKCMTKIYSYTGQPIPAPRGSGVPCSRAPQLWQRGELPTLQLSAHHSFIWAVSGDLTANPLVIGRSQSPLRHGRPKYKHKNTWKKHAYKCIKKTCIQMYEKKHAYKCMKKTHTNTHTNVWKKHACKCMKKRHTNTHKNE